MIELIGALVFGGIVGGAWLNDHLNETNRRGNSASEDCSYYFDKNGIMRHTLTGTRYTDQEIHNTFYRPDPKIAEIKDKYREKYYGVQVRGKLDTFYKTHVFLTKTEADKFYEENNNDDNEIKYSHYMFSDKMLEDAGCQYTFRFVLHFEK